MNVTSCEPYNMYGPCTKSIAYRLCEYNEWVKNEKI